MCRKKILIIDDEEDLCKVTKLNLEFVGDFEVNIATSGRKGVKLAKKIRPDLIILDLIMPGMDGFEVLKRLKKDKDTMEIPVVMLSARKDDIYKSKAFELYDEFYLEKPIGHLQLKTKIEEVLGRKSI
ncbi:MAG: response regulator [bacterium]